MKTLKRNLFCIAFFGILLWTPFNTFAQFSDEVYGSTGSTLSRTIKMYITDVDTSQYPLIQSLKVSVHDHDFDAIAGLKKDNFSIYEKVDTSFGSGYVAQKILDFKEMSPSQSHLQDLDVVFVIDTSLSMSDEWKTLPTDIQSIIDHLRDTGIQVSWKIYGLGSTMGWDRADQLDQGEFRGLPIVPTDESWGPASTFIANNYGWKQQATKVIIPISDECAFGGDPESLKDQESLQEVIKSAHRNNILYFPVVGIGPGDDGVNEMSMLASETNGKVYSLDQISDLAHDLYQLSSTLKSRYELVYETNNLSHEPTMRDVLISVNNDSSQFFGYDVISYPAPSNKRNPLEIDQHGNISIGWKVFSSSGVTEINTSQYANQGYIMNYDGDADLFYYEPSGVHGLLGDPNNTPDNYQKLKDYILTHHNANIHGRLQDRKDSVHTIEWFKQAHYTYYYGELSLTDTTMNKDDLILHFDQIDDGAMIIVNGHLIGFAKIYDSRISTDPSGRYRYQRTFFLNTDYYKQTGVLKDGTNEIIIMKVDDKSPSTGIIARLGVLHNH